MTIPTISFSYEVFPPKTPNGLTNLGQAVDELTSDPTEFISVTYGAGGTNQDGSFAAIAEVDRHANGTDIAAHLTCVGQTVAEIEQVIERYAALDVSRIVALRGDPPGGIDAPYQPHPAGFQSTDSLVAAIKQAGDFWVAVSAYPEVHPQSESVDHDLKVLAAKVDAGADAAMTQMFFDNETFFEYVERVRGAGIKIPIIPGIFPIHSITTVTDFATRCGATMPTSTTERFLEAIAKDESESGEPDETRHQFDTAVTVATEQIVDLANNGIEQVHLYTLNRSPLALAVRESVLSTLDRKHPR